MRSIQLFLILTIAISLSSFTPGRKDKDNVLNIKKRNKHLCKVADDLYAYAYEVSVADYKLFLNEMKSNPSEWKEMIPDTSQWYSLGKQPMMMPMVSHYFSHPAYALHPINNITHCQARTYCDWLTEKYNQTEKREFQKVKFRLPTADEWIQAAKGGYELTNYPHGGVYLRNTDGRFLYNFLAVREGNITRDSVSGDLKVVRTDLGNEFHFTGHFTSPIDSYWPNEFGIYNMSGNVAEMIAEEGVARGGSFNDPGYDIRIQSEKNYTKPDPRIGFRVFMEVLEE